MGKKTVRFWRQLLISLMLIGILPAAKAETPQGGFFVFFKKPSDWNQVFLYTWYMKDGRLIETSGKWPGRALSDASGWYRGFIDQSEVEPTTGRIRLVFNDAKGQQTPDQERSRNGWYVFREGNTVVNRWYELNPEDVLRTLSVRDGEGSGRYAPGSLVRIAAKLPENASFRTWVGEHVALLSEPTQPVTQFQMPDFDVEFRASFEDHSIGRANYERLCANCHGDKADGGVGPALGVGSSSCKSCASDEALQQRIATTMPKGAVGSCVGECAQTISRYLRYGLSDEGVAPCQATASLSRRHIRLLTRREFAHTVRDLFGIGDLAALRYWPEPALVLGYDNNAQANVPSDRHVLVFARAAREIAERTNLRVLGGRECGQDVNCHLSQAGLRLFRRPLSPEEIQRFTAIAKSHSRGEEAALELMLQAPQFLYRSEMGIFLSPRNLYALDAYEIASALAYAVTGSTPDSTLLARAADGSLKESRVRREEALRLLALSSARETFHDFVEQWLGLSGLPFVTRDKPEFTAKIRSDMLEETRRFISQLVFEDNAGVADLFLAERTYVSQDLARYYGWPVPRRDWDPVPFDQNRRGLLGQGSILANYANSQEASPIKRGVFVRNRLLCQELPPPPANVDTTIPPPAPGLTMRERLARHLSQGNQADGSNACFSCHQYIDKLGFGFEAFDEVAKLRLAYAEKPGQPIDVSGEVKSPEQLGEGATLSFQNFSELSKILAESRKTKQCFALQYFRYTHGMREAPADRCVLQRLEKSLLDQGSIKDFIIQTVTDDSFIFRSGAQK